jgi:hypothetical protein
VLDGYEPTSQPKQSTDYRDELLDVPMVLSWFTSARLQPSNRKDRRTESPHRMLPPAPAQAAQNENLGCDRAIAASNEIGKVGRYPT